jgi:DNA modification methylase
LVALDVGRQYIGIELNPEYVAMTERRMSQATIGLALEQSEC